MSKQQFMEQKTGGSGKQDNYKSPQQGERNENQSPSNRPQGSGGGNFRTRANKTNKNRGRIEDVNDKNLNRPDFNPKKKGSFGEDKPPRKQGGGVRSYENNYRKKSTNQQQSSTNPRGRVHERKSGTGLDQGTKKNEALTENVGDPIKENMKSEELKKPKKKKNLHLLNTSLNLMKKEKKRKITS